MNESPKIALFEPDIPQNTAAIIRLSACLNLKIHIIEPCGFNLNDPRFKRVVMDYLGFSKILRYEDYNEFISKNKKKRIVLMTTKGSINYTKFKFKPDDTILFGRESAGVPEKIHKLIKDRLKIPMNNQVRSLNIASSVAIVLAESLRQIKIK